jgi:hypothetical protein
MGREIRDRDREIEKKNYPLLLPLLLPVNSTSNQATNQVERKESKDMTTEYCG